jgi:hypothetical protein
LNLHNEYIFVFLIKKFHPAATLLPAGRFLFKAGRELWTSTEAKGAVQRDGDSWHDHC